MCSVGYIIDTSTYNLLECSNEKKIIYNNLNYIQNIGPIGPRGATGSIGATGNCYGEYLFWDPLLNDFRIGGTTDVNIGCDAGRFNQGFNADPVLRGNAVAIGTQAGLTDQGRYCVAIGFQSGLTSQLGSAVAVGERSGKINQGSSSVAIGSQSGESNQGQTSVAVGAISGQISQGSNTVAIGNSAGRMRQGASCVAVGYQAGDNNQGNAAVAIGSQAGFTGQGQNCIAIGYKAGENNQNRGSIVLNSSGVSLNTTGTTGYWYVRTEATGGLTENTGNQYLTYNTTTFEITRSTAAVSDLRTKINKQDLDSSESYELIKSLSPKQFCLRSEPNTIRFGLIADEVKTIQGLANTVLTESNVIPFANRHYTALVTNEFISKDDNKETSRIFEYTIIGIVEDIPLTINDKLLLRKCITDGNFTANILNIIVNGSEKTITIQTNIILDNHFINLSTEERSNISLINQTYPICIVGVHVDNLLTLHYQDIFIRHLSATQEIMKRLEVLENTVKNQN
jgi:hypothetical protein